MPQSPLFQFHQASKSFGPSVVLENLNLRIQPGEFLVLLGPSGCGKSTVLRLLAGLEDLSAGKLDKAQTPNLSYVFQDPRLLPWRSVCENVLLPFELLRKPAPNPKPWLEKVGLWEARDLYPHQLSGGMRMRASLARALITNPDILLLDEPLSSLDEVTREELQDFLRQLWSEKSFTTIFVTHSLREAVFLGQRLVIMGRDHGKILHDDPLPELKRDGETRSSGEFQALVHQLTARFRAALREDL